MEDIWVTLAEVQMEQGDVSSGNTLGFMKIIAWAESEEAFLQKIRNYFEMYRWHILEVEDIRILDASSDHGDELNQMIDEALKNKSAIKLGTFHTYPSKLN